MGHQSRISNNRLWNVNSMKVQARVKDVGSAKVAEPLDVHENV